MVAVAYFGHVRGYKITPEESARLLQSLGVVPEATTYVDALQHFIVSLVRGS